MPTYTTAMTVTYSVGTITDLDNNLIDFNKALAELNDLEPLNLQDVRWLEVTPGVWQFRVRFIDGRKFVADGSYPTLSPTTTHTVNTDNDQFTDVVLAHLQALRLAWIRLVVQRQITNDLHTYTYTP